MVKWSFNALLLSKLSNVLDLSVSEIARRCNINQPVLYHNIKGDTEMTVQTLIQICNGLRMPSRYFISEDDRHVIPNRETATVETDQWKPVSWDNKTVELTFGDGEGKIYWKDVAEVQNVTPQKPHNRFLLRTSFPIGSFLKTCTHYNISPFRFLIDPNEPVGSKHRKNEDILTNGSKKQKSTSPPSYSELSRRVDKLEQDIADLTTKFNDLQQKHEALARRVQVNIQNVHNSHIGINDNMDLVAEDREGENNICKNNHKTDAFG